MFDTEQEKVLISRGRLADLEKQAANVNRAGETAGSELVEEQEITPDPAPVEHGL